ncbi:conserved hypothetical protein [gamma proteobacterium HdN1]|nr:conserved hypothetical protein [gamma proteobacterium HdN1]
MIASFCRFSYRKSVTTLTLIALAALLHTQPARAGSPDHYEPYHWNEPSLALAKSLANTPKWHALLHYYPSGITGRWESQADSAAFFLAPNGKRDPEAELRATVDAFYQTPNGNAPIANAPNGNDTHPICRFPARWRWLTKKLSLPPTPITPTECPEFQEWLGILKPNSVTLVFASSYLNSPSSMFGHTFLRLDPKDIQQGSAWLSYAVNFGAEYHAEDNSIMYAWKGILGGYPGFFSVLPYHQKINEYNRIENRDLWEYRLNLSPQETSALVDHLWELKNIDFAYYFFDHNCSFRLLELLEFARPSIELTDHFQVRAIPIDTVRAVLRADLVDHVEYRPSKATELQFQASQLNSTQQTLAVNLAKGQRAPNDPALQTLSPTERAQVLRVAYKSLRYDQDNAQRDASLARRSLSLLRALQTEDNRTQSPPPPPATPESGHDTLLIGLSGGQIIPQSTSKNRNAADHLNMAELRLRSSYHDLADRAQGYLDGAAINIGELVLRQTENDSLQIELANFIEIDSHAARNRWFSPLTWRVKAGADRIYSDTDSALTPRIEGGAGLTYNLFNRHLIYGLGMARLEYNPLLSQDFSAGAGALTGALFYWPFGTLQIESAYYQFSDGHERSSAHVIQNFPLAKNHAIRLQLGRSKQINTTFNEAMLEYRYYFY